MTLLMAPVFLARLSVRDTLPGAVARALLPLAWWGEAGRAMRQAARAGVLLARGQPGMAEAVVAVEEDPDMLREAQALLAEHGADNVVLHHGPLADGAPEHGPFDAIVIEGGVEHLPQALTDQLKEGGRMACLFMEGALGAVRIGYKIDGHMTWRFAFNAGAPVLPGFERHRAFTF